MADKPYTYSTIGGIIGAKRSCKSLLLAATIIHKLIEGGCVWSNMKVKTGKTVIARKYAPSGRLINYTESQMVDWDLLYRLDESLVEGTVALDEIGYSASSSDTMTTKNKLIASCVRQAGHRNLDFWFTAREFTWVDYRLRDETDVLIVANDLTYKPWGQFHHLPGGTVAHLLYFDVSGQITGTPVGERIKGLSAASLQEPSFSRLAYKDTLFYGPPYQDCYDTKEIVPIEDLFTKVKLDFKKRVIGNGGDYSQREVLKEKVLQGIRAFVAMGKNRIPTFAFWEYLKTNLGVDGDPKTLGRYVPREVIRCPSYKGFQYDFSGLEL